jgi:hypothetical protein
MPPHLNSLPKERFTHARLAWQRVQGTLNLFFLLGLCGLPERIFSEQEKGQPHDHSNNRPCYDSTILPGQQQCQRSAGECVHELVDHTLDDLLRVRALGVTRIGATATEAILEEARKRGYK